MKNVILEKALVQYDNEGKYDYTIESDYFFFKDMEDAKDFAMCNLERNYEFFFYKILEEQAEQFEDEERIDKDVTLEILDGAVEETSINSNRELDKYTIINKYGEEDGSYFRTIEDAKYYLVHACGYSDEDIKEEGIEIVEKDWSLQ